MGRRRSYKLLGVDPLGAVPVLRGVTLVKQSQTPLDALERLDALPFQSDQHGLRVLIGAGPDLVRLALAGGNDFRRLDLRGLGELALLDKECGLLLRAGEDALGFFLGALDDAL